MSRVYESFDNTITVVISLGLRKLLDVIYKTYNDPIAIKIVKLHRHAYGVISYLDRSSDIDKISYTRSSRIADKIIEKGYDLHSPDIYKVKEGWITNRDSMRIGKFINKTVGGTQSEIENFINRFKSESKKDISGLEWKRVAGTGIKTWYNYDMYVKGGGTLNRSCLRKHDKNEFLNFFANNPNKVRLFTLTNNEHRLLGRALHWKLDEPEGRIFMDRIYTRFDSDVNLFIESAQSNGWLYKSKQTFGGDIPITDGRNGETKVMRMVVNDFKMGHRFAGYPYMDTFQFYNFNTKTLTNDPRDFKKGVIKLNKVDGGYTAFGDVENDIDMLGH